MLVSLAAANISRRLLIELSISDLPGMDSRVRNNRTDNLTPFGIMMSLISKEQIYESIRMSWTTASMQMLLSLVMIGGSSSQWDTDSTSLAWYGFI